MSVATLNKKDFGIGQMAKKFSHTGSGIKTISALKTVIQLTTSKESVKHSQDILNNVTLFAKGMCVSNKKKVKIVDLKKFAEQTNNNIQFTDAILSDINNVVDGGSALVIDDENMKQFISNIKQVKNMLEYVSDFLNLAIEVQNAKKDIADGKGVKYTLDELLEKLKSAA